MSKKVNEASDDLLKPVAPRFQSRMVGATGEQLLSCNVIGVFGLLVAQGIGVLQLPISILTITVVVVLGPISILRSVTTLVAIWKWGKL